MGSEMRLARVGWRRVDGVELRCAARHGDPDVLEAEEWEVGVWWSWREIG